MNGKDIKSEYMDGEASAKYLHTTPRKIALYRRYGLLKYAKLGKSFLYRREWLDDFMEEWAGFNISSEFYLQIAIASRRSGRGTA